MSTGLEGLQGSKNIPTFNTSKNLFDVLKKVSLLSQDILTIFNVIKEIPNYLLTKYIPLSGNANMSRYDS